VSAGGPEAGQLRHHPRGSLQRAALRFGVLVVLLVGALAAVRFTPLGEWVSVERLQALFDGLRKQWWAPVAHVGVTALGAALGVPASVFLAVGAAIFGVAWGTLWNWAGVLLASVLGYFVARALGREFVERIGGDKVKRAERLLHRRGFLPLVAVRFLPLPLALVNAVAAVVGVRFPKFLLATAIGILPPIAILTYFAAALLEAAAGEQAAIARNLAAAFGGAVLLVFVPLRVRRLLRRRRLRELRARRAARARA
jgi:phospholipase D1/2